MDTSHAFLIFNQSCEDAVQWIDRRLGAAGLQTVLTFDFQAARSARVECACPYHGSHPCDCQMVVLLVYSRTGPVDGCGPVSLMIHGREGRTWLYLIDTPQQRADVRLEAVIRQILSPAMEE